MTLLHYQQSMQLILNNKHTQRTLISTRISNMTTAIKRSASQRVCTRLNSLASIEFANTIFVYLPIKDEVDLTPIIAQWLNESRSVVVPLVSWDSNTMSAGLLTSLKQQNLIKTKNGLLEPAIKHPLPADLIDVIIVPGIGFDATGMRLGRGGGYYDRYLSAHRPPIVIGVAFDEQIDSSIFHEHHDQMMTAIVTPTRTLLHS